MPQFRERTEQDWVRIGKAEGRKYEITESGSLIQASSVETKKPCALPQVGPSRPWPGGGIVPECCRAASGDGLSFATAIMAQLMLDQCAEPEMAGLAAVSPRAG